MKRLASGTIVICMCISVSAAFFHPALAGLAELTSRPATGDIINWGQIAPPTPSTFTTPQEFTSTSGITGTATLAEDGNGAIYEQCCVGIDGTFDGNFAPGDLLFYTEKSGPLTMKFDTALSTVGAQISANTYGAFTAEIRAFDGNRYLGMFMENGELTTNADNSNIFLGVSDTVEGITSIVYSLTASQGLLTDFAINQMSVAPAPVREPASLSVLCAGLISFVLVWIGERRRYRGAVVELQLGQWLAAAEHIIPDDEIAFPMIRPPGRFGRRSGVSGMSRHWLAGR
jgi:hypothetical protein